MQCNLSHILLRYLHLHKLEEDLLYHTSFFLKREVSSTRCMHYILKSYCYICTVPSVTPNITVFGRTDATSLQLSWDTLSLEELRGFFHSYAVAYYELDTFQCMDIDPSTSQLTAVHKPFIVISDLVPGKEYCVGVAARTSAGVGNYTQLLIPCKCIHFCNVIFITSMKAISRFI